MRKIGSPSSVARRSLAASGTHRIGIDLGGTKIEGLVLDPTGHEIARKRVATRQEEGYQAILGSVQRLYRELCVWSPEQEHTLGIGTPGAVSPRTGLLKNSNTLCLNGRPLKSDLETLLDRPIALQNDANCFALAEALHGAGRGGNLVFGVIMGTGCGGGIVYRGEVITGPQAIAGEWGHTSIDPNGPLCYCGRHGCVETFISGGGLEARYAERYGEPLSFLDIARNYEKNDPDSAAFVKVFLRNFGRAMANLIDVLDPDVVVLGGGVSNFDALYTDGVAEVAGCVFSDSLETPIVRNQLGDSAGVIGAALIGV